MGESPIKTRCIDDRLSFERARHRLKKKALTPNDPAYPASPSYTSGHMSQFTDNTRPVGSSASSADRSGRGPFFYLDAAWLNEGRCPGGRPSVSEN